VLDVLHCPGNVHDSNASAFTKSYVSRVKKHYSGVTLVSRIDSAFFNEEIISTQESLGVGFTTSVSIPFARFLELKERVEQ
jgi:hypothetical protein